MTELDKINAIAVAMAGTAEFRIESYAPSDLLITGSFDFAYYHEVEVEFREVSYMALPTSFSAPRFRLASAAETDAVGKLVALTPADIVYCIEAETVGSRQSRLPFYVVAESMAVREVRVSYRTEAAMKAE